MYQTIEHATPLRQRMGQVNTSSRYYNIDEIRGWHTAGILLNESFLIVTLHEGERRSNKPKYLPKRN